jgi:hypothetical protein
MAWRITNKGQLDSVNFRFRTTGKDRKVQPDHHQITHRDQTVTRFCLVTRAYIGTASGVGPAADSPLPPLAVPHGGSGDNARAIRLAGAEWVLASTDDPPEPMPALPR